MLSTSISEKPLIECENVGLVLRTELYPTSTFRDSFTKFISNPIDALLKEKERLAIAKDISFSIRRGERVGLIGANGSGKTSLCRCIAGLYRPSSGSIRVQGPMHAVFDTALGIQPELTGRENAELLSHFLFPDHPERSDIVREALEFSELGHFLDMPYRIYSKGMQSRLCLSLVSCRPHEIVILDEVFDGADVFFQEKVAARMLKMIKDSGAVLFVSHSAEQIRNICTRVIVMSKGVIVHDGDVEAGLRAYGKQC